MLTSIAKSLGVVVLEVISTPLTGVDQLLEPEELECENVSDRHQRQGDPGEDQPETELP